MMSRYENPGVYISAVYRYETPDITRHRGTIFTLYKAVLLWDRVSDLDVSCRN